MNTGKENKNWFPIAYEVFVWVLYTCLYKYAYYVDQVGTPGDPGVSFPHPRVLLYALLLTLYIIPLYRWIIPFFLNTKKYTQLIFITILFLLFIPKISNWLVSSLFMYLNNAGELKNFYLWQATQYKLQVSHIMGWDFRILFTDFTAFCSVAGVRYAFENEQKRRLLERDNLQLQLASLKAQLNPHFLFNTLNSIYGMSITGSKETPQFILRLSDMMRYVLYDCSHNKVPLEKDIEFLENYFEMEKKRYPNADIRLSVKGEMPGKLIAPLLLIPFVENGFKHGAHRLNDTGFVQADLEIKNKELLFEITNDVFTTIKEKERYGGVGIENVKKRLNLYYPRHHGLDIENDSHQYKVTLKISFN